MTADPTRPERIIAADQAATDEDAHRVFDQLDAAVESLVTSVTTLAGLGVVDRSHARHLRRVQREMAAADERAARDGAA